MVPLKAHQNTTNPTIFESIPLRKIKNVILNDMNIPQSTIPKRRIDMFLKKVAFVCLGASFVSFFVYTPAAEILFIIALACGLGAAISYFRMSKSERTVVQETPQIAGNDAKNSMDSNTKRKLLIAVALPLIAMLLTFVIAPMLMPHPHPIPYDDRVVQAADAIGRNIFALLAIPSFILCVINLFVSISLLKKTNVGTYLIVYTLLIGGLIWMAFAFSFAV